MKKKDGSTEKLTCDKLIIATGATTRLIPGTSLSERVVTYEEQILDADLPGSIVIAGSGAIGVEFAYVMKNFGVDVTIVEFLDRMVPTEDAEVSKELLRHYKKLGVNVLLETKVESIDDSGEKVKVTVSPADGGETQVIETDKVLQAIGFAPRRRGLRPRGAGVQATDRGAIAIDDYGRTNVDNVYAIGDVHRQADAGPHRRGEGRRRRRDDGRRRDDAGRVRLHPAGDLLPAADRLLRLLRGAGQGEGLRRQGREVPVLRQRQGEGLGDAVGFVKIVADAKYNEILGAHLIGPDVTELLPALTLAQHWDLTADEVARNVFAHPTLSEAVKEAVEGIAGHMINL